VRGREGLSRENELLDDHLIYHLIEHLIDDHLIDDHPIASEVVG
jgi:hypothetical protein